LRWPAIGSVGGGDRMAKADWHLAQLNVGRIVAPTDNPVLADFMGALDRINALAEQSPGFVWRLQGEGGNATDILTTPDPYFLINMSVWKSIEELFEFVYRSAHTEFMVRRREWFERPAEAYQVLWWVPAGYLPSPTEALARLDYLRAHGASPYAFTFKKHFPPPYEVVVPPADMKPEPYCVGWA
jgi:hypothetical protein